METCNRAGVVWRSTLVFLVLLLGVRPGHAAPEDAIRLCTDQMRARTAAFVARDWAQVERLAKEFVRECKNVLDAEDVGNAYEQIAIASVELDNLAAARAAEDACINILYAHAGCHVSKVGTLIKLDRLAEARTALDMAQRLIKHAVEITEEKLVDAPDQASRRVYLAKLRKLNAYQSYAERLRQEYFTK